MNFNLGLMDFDLRIIVLFKFLDFSPIDYAKNKKMIYCLMTIKLLNVRFLILKKKKNKKVPHRYIVKGDERFCA